MANSTLMKAEEYVNTYYSQLKDELNARGLQISKVGLIGLLLHILGFTQQDIKLYYDTLFREAFIATADKYENLVMHGTIYGYVPALATPALLTGNIALDIAAIPVSNDTGVTITLEDLKIKVDDLIFILDSKYLFKNQNCQIIDENNNITSVPLSTTEPVVPIQNFKQYDIQEFTYTIPFYVYNSYYGLTIDLDSDEKLHVWDIELSVQEEVNGEFIPYEYRLVNYSSGNQDRHIFVQFLPNGKIFLELGSGAHGKYIPNTTLHVKVKTTYGSLGNISNQSVMPYEGNIRIYDNITGASYSIPVTTGITVNIDYASNGTDPLDSLDLRSAIIEFIRHRNNLVSEMDFYNILKFYFEDFELMFKKTHVMDNNIFCFVPIRTTYQHPARTRSISLKHPDFNPNSKCILYNPIWTLENGKQYISPFLYSVDFGLRVYRGYILREYNSSYFNEIITEYKAASGNEIIALPLALYTYYNASLDTTRFMVQSYESLGDYVLKMDIPKLGIYDVCLDLAEDNIVNMYYYDSANGTGIVFGKIDVIVKVYNKIGSLACNAGTLLFTYKLYDYAVCLDISDILSLKSFDGFVTEYLNISVPAGMTDAQQQVLRNFNKDSYILNIPVIELEEYESDSDYYLQKQVDTLGSVAFQQNRMISDDVQIRYLNTDVVLADQLVASTVQKHNFDIELPLKLNVSIYANQDYVNEYNVNTVESRKELIETLAQKLFDKYTGTNIAFYRTQIVDLIHNEPWVKHCIVKVYDNKDVEIPDANFEVRPQLTIIDDLDKLGAVKYCPFYIWWDLENISVTIIYE